MARPWLLFTTTVLFWAMTTLALGQHAPKVRSSPYFQALAEQQTRQAAVVQDQANALDSARVAKTPYPRENSNRVLRDEQGAVIPLPQVCTDGLPPEAFGQPSQEHGQTGGRGPSRVLSQASYPPQSYTPQQWRDALQLVVHGEAEEERGEARNLTTAEYQEQVEARQRASVATYLQLAGKQPPSPVAPASYNPHAKATAANRDQGVESNSHLLQSLDPDCDPHQELFAESLFPSAVECAKCHQQIFDEWASSSHAYAAVSPMFHKFEDTINRLSQGTLGYFCLRCHAPVATTVGLRRDQAIWDGPRVFREGVTCIACHHVQEVNVKVNGERRIEPGDLTAPVTGSSNGAGVEATIKFKDHFKVKTDLQDKAVGQVIHKRVFQFQEISESTFCVSCHQVAVQPGIKLEVVWDQYRASPACREGTSCQDCHMGKVPGVAEGYSLGPAAVIDGRVVNPLRKHSNHLFYGPGYSIAHPGIFPHDPAQDRWTFNQWLEFDWRAGWGTDKFEDWLVDNQVEYYFPPAWREVDDRYDARDVVDRNIKRLEYKKATRRQVMENGSQLDGPFFDARPQRGEDLSFRYCVINKSKGHNMPSGSLGAQPQLWLNVVLIGPDGCRLWESGYLDSNGDLADLHSLDVLARKIPLDRQLFNLQTKFLTTNVKGTDREMYLPVNFDFDQLPFLRPATQPVTVLNHPPFIRMEGHSIPALGSRNAKYEIPGELLCEPGVYRLSVRMRSRAEPIYFMKFVGATDEMIRSMNEWIVDVHPYTVTFEIR